jgi:hypothetical protein
LAGWVLGPAKHLTARVFVNRVWQHHFGAGLVNTPNDFGTRGSPPTHPELLDYLANRFIASGWSVKQLHRLILLSEAYQRRTATSEHAVSLPTLAIAGALSGHAGGGDPANTLLAHFPRRRLSAEEIRDAILAVSGDLDPRPATGHPFPPESAWGFTQHNPFSAVYDHDHRSVYLMIQRIKRHPFLALFDGADPNASTADRLPTTVPTQALFFLNDPFVHAKSASLARRLEPLSGDDARLDRAFRLLYARAPSSRELDSGKQFLARYAAVLPNGNSEERHRVAWAAWLRVMFAGNEFIYVD